MFRFLFLTGIIVVCALGYVRQQVKIICLGYELQKKEKDVEQVVKENKFLSYKIAALETPSRLEASLDNEGLYRPLIWDVKYLPPEPARVKVAFKSCPSSSRGARKAFSLLFNWGKEAQAQEPSSSRREVKCY